MILQFENSSEFFGIVQILKFLVKKEEEGKECHMRNSIRSYNILLRKKKKRERSVQNESII